MCQRKKYISEDFINEPDDGMETLYDWNEIEDFLVLADVNSLYPTAQFKFEYAYGNWQYHKYTEEEG